MAWTDERMDDLSTRMDAGFERVEKDIRDLRAEIGSTRDELKRDNVSLRAELKRDNASLRAELKRDNASLRAELKGDIADLRSDVGDLRTLTMRFGIALLVGMIGMIATLMGVIATVAVGA